MSRWWSSSCGQLNLELTVEDAASGSHQGDCEEDVRALLERPDIASQVDAWDADMLRDHLREYGAWDDEDLADDEMNKVRQLWLACGDINEEVVE